jgi:dTDP-4-dehydrorhamnose reductase
MKALVTGASGQLGSEIVEAFRTSTSYDIVALGHDELDVCDHHAVFQALLGEEPDVVVHAAAYTDVDGAQSDPKTAFAVNGWGSRNVAVAAKEVDAYVCYISSDYVFDGLKQSYTEWDAPNPISVYGASKLAGEKETRWHAPRWSIVRTAWLSGRRGRNFVKTVLELKERRPVLEVVDDQRGSPSFAKDVARKVVEICVRRLQGIFHVTNSGSATWLEVARAILEEVGDDPSRVVPISTEKLGRPAPRPACSVLENRCLDLAGLDPLRGWRPALSELLRELS